MPGSLKTEAIVLRSIRYGEADRILHLYTPRHGRLGAIAKGARRARSRFGARLEPFFRIRAVLHEGRGELHTVTSADTIAAHAALREHAATLDAAARACDAVARLFETSEPHPEVFTLLANELALLSADHAHARPANGLAFRLKLLLAAGIVPQLARARRAASPSTCAASRPPPAASCAAPARRRRSRSARRPTVPGGRARAAARAGAGRLRARAAPGRACDLRDRRAPRPRPPAPAAARDVDELRHKSARRPTGAVRIASVSEQTPEQPATSIRTGHGRRVSQQRIRAREERELSPLATRSYPATASRPEPDCGLRTPFQRDRDRIVHCKAFRRLKHKTQVFVAPDRRPLPDAPDAHARGHAGLADRRARAAAERGSRRGDRPRPRPRPPAVRPHRRGRARPLPGGAVRLRVHAPRAVAAGRRRARARRQG